VYGVCGISPCGCVDDTYKLLVTFLCPYLDFLCVYLSVDMRFLSHNGFTLHQCWNSIFGNLLVNYSQTIELTIANECCEYNVYCSVVTITYSQGIRKGRAGKYNEKSRAETNA